MTLVFGFGRQTALFHRSYFDSEDLAYYLKLQQNLPTGLEETVSKKIGELFETLFGPSLVPLKIHTLIWLFAAEISVWRLFFPPVDRLEVGCFLMFVSLSLDFWMGF